MKKERRGESRRIMMRAIRHISNIASESSIKHKETRVRRRRASRSRRFHNNT